MDKNINAHTDKGVYKILYNKSAPKFKHQLPPASNYCTKTKSSLVSSGQIIKILS